MVRRLPVAVLCIALSAALSRGDEPSGQNGRQPSARGASAAPLLLADTAKPPAKPPTTASQGKGEVADPMTFEQLEAQAKKQSSIAAVLALYQRFLANPLVDKPEKKLARERLAYWKELQSKGAVRIGGKWLTATELAQLEEQERLLTDQGLRMLEAGSGSQAERKFIAAGKANPTGVIGLLFLGLYHALNKRDAPAAEKDFAECVKRLKHKDLLSNNDRANLVAALNNLAIAESRQRKYASAVKNWKESTALADPPIEVVQNIGRFVHLSEIEPTLGISKEAALAAGNVFSNFSIRADGRSFLPFLGWLYIGAILPKDAKQDKPNEPEEPKRKAGEPILFSFGSGFVVQPGRIVTNHHVIEDADVIEIALRRNQAVMYKARLLADSPAEDTALLECLDIQQAPVPFSLDPPRLATDVMVLGYPEPEKIGTGLKVVKGTISGLPDPNIKNQLLYDAPINQGSSGGPVCDQRGRVVALNRAFFRLNNNVSAGVPAATVLAFLKKEIPAFEQPPAADKPLGWEDVADKVGESTVFINIFLTPAHVRALGYET
ncbi:MAG TPA: trypsin-like peptidase domain-containing protein, partial [Pirellulales bacterium]|nr:trypsin-like peptidase domain-containing protein [Pirellulales bacterium]